MMAIDFTKYLLLFVLSSASFGDTLEIFLNKGDKAKLAHLSDARSKNISIVYYFLDEKELLESVVKNAITTEFNKALDELKAKSKAGELLKLSDDELTKRVFELYQKKYGDRYKNIIKSLMDGDYMAQINRANQDILYAKDNGVSPDDLPAMIYKRRIVKNNYDVKRIIK